MKNLENLATAVKFSLLLSIKAIFMAEGVRKPLGDGEWMASPSKMQRYIKMEMLEVLESTLSAEDQGKALAEKGLVLGLPLNGKFELFDDVKREYFEIEGQIEKELEMPSEVIMQSLQNNMLAVFASFPSEYMEALEWAQLAIEDSLKVVVEPAQEEEIEQAVETTPEMNSEFQEVAEIQTEATPEGTDAEGDDAETEGDDIPGTGDDETEVDTTADSTEETAPATEEVPEMTEEHVDAETETPAQENETPETTPVIEASIQPTVEVISENVKIVDASTMKGGIEFIENEKPVAILPEAPVAVAKARELIFDSFKSMASNPAFVNPSEPLSLPLHFINRPILTIPRECYNIEILSPVRLEEVLRRIENEKASKGHVFDREAETTRLMARKPGLSIGVVLTNIEGESYKLGCSPKNFEPGFCWPQIDIIDVNKNVLTVPAILEFTATSYMNESGEKATLSGIGEVDGDVCFGYIPVVVEENRQTTASVIKMLKEGYEFIATARATTRDSKYYNFWRAPMAKPMELKFQNPTPSYIKGVVGNLPI